MSLEEKSQINHLNLYLKTQEVVAYDAESEQKEADNKEQKAMKLITSRQTGEEMKRAKNLYWS